MPRCHNILLAALLLGLVLGSGCAKSSSTAKSTPGRKHARTNETAIAFKPPPTDEELERMEEEAAKAVEPRAEGLARFARGFANEMQGDRREALEQYFAAAMADAANEPLVIDVTRNLIAARRFTMARELLVKGSSQSNAPAIYFSQLGWIYLQTGDTNEAIAANLVAINREPRDLTPYQNLVSIYLERREPEEARKVLDRASTVTAPEALYLVNLADLYTKFSAKFTNESAQAKIKSIALLNRARAMSPQTAGVILKIADGYNWHGETKLAAEVYLDMLKQFAEQTEIRDAIRARLTDLYLRGKDRKKAAEQLQELVKDNPNNPQAYYALGAIEFEEKQFDLAVEHLSKVTVLAPDFEQGYYDLVGALLNADKTDEALATLDKARARFNEKGGRFTIEYYTALAYSRKKDNAAALKAFTQAEVIARATETNRLTAFFYFQLGAAHERNKHYEDAEIYFQKSLRMDDEFAEAHNYLGYMWAERGVHLEAARRHIETALQLEPKNAAYLDSLGWVLYKQHKYQDALKNILDAVKLTEKPDATLHDHLGDIYAALNQMDNAREQWRKSLELEASDEIKKKLDGRNGP